MSLNVFLLMLGAGGLAGILFGRMYYQQWKEKQELAEIRAGRRQFLEGEFETLSDRYVLEPTFCGADGYCAVGHAWANKSLVFVSGVYYDEQDEELETPRATVRAVDAQDLIGCVVLEDTFVRTNKTGGKPQTYVRSLDLKINVADTREPVYILTFLLGEVLTGSAAHREARDALHQWEGIIKALIHNAARAPDVAEKLAELDLLVRQGVLADEDFKRQKARLLASQFVAEGRTRDWASAGAPQLREVGTGK
ncbi:MAG: hypothetical protein ACI8PZ_003861 [Myxococcota bacterium]